MNHDAGKQTNPLGTAGFIVSLVGFCAGGLLSPIGLIMSLFALKNEPKGLAIAGVVIGAVGSCGIIISLLFLPFAILGALLAVGATGAALGLAAMIGGPELEAQVEMTILDGAIQKYEDDNGSLPDSLADVQAALDANLAGIFTDHWGEAYYYEPTGAGRGYRLFSAGPDGIPDTADDIRYQGSVEWNTSGSGSSWAPSGAGSAPDADLDREIPAETPETPDVPTDAPEDAPADMPTEPPSDPSSN